MTNDKTKSRERARAMIARLSVQELAEAGANGRVLTQAEMMAVCEALRVRSVRVPNAFHTGM